MKSKMITNDCIKIITGGIGSGKSYVCNKLKKCGFKIYDCDQHAKRLMLESQTIRDGLIALIGNDAYFDDGHLNKAAVAEFLLRDKKNNQAINAIVHPIVAQDFLLSGMSWMESAIYFESHFGKRFTFERRPIVICVTAPLEVRILRIMKRDCISHIKAEEWITRQMSQEEKCSLSDFIIDNNGDETFLQQQIEKLMMDIK